MHKDKREKLTGTGGADKTPVMGLLQRHSKKIPVSQVVAEVVPNVRRGVLVGAIKKYVKK